jgi:hypothetical protein
MPMNAASKLNFGTGPFNIQFFVKLASTHSTLSVYQAALNSNACTIYISSLNRLSISTPGGSTTFSTSTVFTTGIWQHAEISRDASGVIRGFINGTLLGTTQTYTGSLSSTTTDFLYFGGSDSSHTTFYDELRIVTGDPIHVASFTPPTVELT